MTTLKEKQSQFFQSLHQENKDLSPQFKENSIASAEERWGAYSYAYMARIVEAIQMDFELLEKQMGQEDLAKQIESAIREQPSMYYSISAATQIFIDYFKRTGEAKYVELADYEWFTTLLSDHGSVSSNLIQNISQYKEEQMMDLYCIVNPSLKIIESHWEGLDTIHNTYNENTLHTYAVFSYKKEVVELPLDVNAKKLLLAIQQKTTFGDLSELAIESMQEIIFQWANIGLLVDVNLKD